MGMKKWVTVCIMVILCGQNNAQPKTGATNPVYVNYYNSDIQFRLPSTADIVSYADLNSGTMKIYYNRICRSDYQYLLRQLLTYKDQLNLNDYFYYKLVSATDKVFFHDNDLATFYDWFFMMKSGYDVRLLITRGNHFMLSAATDERPENISYYNYNDKSYVMLNDPGDNYNHPFISAFPDERMPVGGTTLFSFQLYGEPHIPLGDSIKRTVHFNHKGKDYIYTYYLSKNMLDAFSNYPSVDEGFNCNVDASDITYRSLILQMKHDVSNMDTLSGLSFILSFVRTSTHYERDLQQFGKVKWMIPEEALYYNSNDCADRAPLMVYLVKAIYNLPVILLNYPDHLSMAVALARPPYPKAIPIVYDNERYYLCEATELTDLLGVGEIPKQLRNQPYRVVCSYRGAIKKLSLLN
jgi:hypothetical protein